MHKTMSLLSINLQIKPIVDTEVVIDVKCEETIIIANK